MQNDCLVFVQFNAFLAPTCPTKIKQTTFGYTQKYAYKKSHYISINNIIKDCFELTKKAFNIATKKRKCAHLLHTKLVVGTLSGIFVLYQRFTVCTYTFTSPCWAYTSI